jgi:hypothetical protein
MVLTANGMRVQYAVCHDTWDEAERRVSDGGGCLERIALPEADELFESGKGTRVAITVR